MADQDLLEARPGMEHFTRTLAAFLEFVQPPIQEVLGTSGEAGTTADQLALAEAYAIVSAFVPVDGTVSEDEAAALVRAGGRNGASVFAAESDREDLQRFLERGRASATGRSFGLACCALRDAEDGGVRGRRYLRLAGALAEATCALDGESNDERREVRALEEHLFEELQDNFRRIRTGGLRIELPNGARRGTETGETAPQPRRATSEAEPPESVEDALAALERLIGLRSVKEQVTTITSLLRVQQRRRALGLPVPVSSHHMVFVGPPGTGKTTVARLLGRIFRALGLLEHGEVREVAREDLVGGYLGETAMKADRVVDEALGGILFVDEAYTLAPENPQDSFGREAIATLVKRMEDDRDRFVLIVAGYEEEMRRFLASNPGLSSRFPETIRFPDYSPEELGRILALFVEDAGYRLAPDAERHAAETIRERWARRDQDFGNARMIRNLFEDMIAAHANRVADDQDADADKLCRIEAADVDTAVRRAREQLDVS